MTVLGRLHHPSASNEDLADLVGRIGASRDKQAFAILYSLLGPKIRGFLVSAGAREAQAEELTQEVMLVVWQRAAEFDPRRSSVTSWIYRIARNRRIDAARREQTRRANPYDPILLREAPQKPDEALSERLAEEQLNDAIGTLSPEQSDLLRLSFFDELSHRGIAEETGLPLGTVKSRLRLGLDHLRKALDA